MPQMAPLSWINLFMLFVFMFMLMSVMNYFSLTYTNKADKNKILKSSFNWKW